MTIVQTMIAIWLGGWVISAAAYLWSSVKAARRSGRSWSFGTNLMSIMTLMVTWLPTLVVYIYAWIIQLRVRGS